MKSLLDVEELTPETKITLDKLQELHDNLAEELCMDQDAQTNNELFKRYVKAYDKLQELLVEYHERNNG
jgi:hypothetical protein